MALYFCTGAWKNEQLFTHYALNVPLYTHFTSPIRRYADIIVHRLLAFSLSAYHFFLQKVLRHTKAGISAADRISVVSNTSVEEQYTKEQNRLRHRFEMMHCCCVALLQHLLPLLCVRLSVSMSLSRLYLFASH